MDESYKFLRIVKYNEVKWVNDIISSTIFFSTIDTEFVFLYLLKYKLNIKIQKIGIVIPPC